MQFVQPTLADRQLFLDWAAVENWRVPEREQQLFQGYWRPYFFALRTAGTVQGFVSAVSYRESGWIGNLLVDPERRGHGYGSALFDFALDFLRQRNLKRIWLTASLSGRPIYQRRGFVSIDRVERWQGNGLGISELEKRELQTELIELDRNCWGESRAHLLSDLVADGDICRSGETFGLLQPGGAGWQLGPWLSPNKCPLENRLLLTEALAKTPAGRPLIVDALVSAKVTPLLRNTDFFLTGSNELMCLSEAPVISLDGVFALASLGSIG